MTFFQTREKKVTNTIEVISLFVLESVVIHCRALQLCKLSFDDRIIIAFYAFLRLSSTYLHYHGYRHIILMGKSLLETVSKKIRLAKKDSNNKKSTILFQIT